ncbi:hypothetical protein [Streptomyces sp. NPDC054837]
MQAKGASRRDSSGFDVETALDELYATLPSAFVSRREELAAAARTAGHSDDARRIHAARRPTLGAWAVNLLWRLRREESRQFLQLGQALREAYSSLDAAGLKELSAQRRHVITVLSRQATQLAREAGYRLSDSVQLEVESTLRAVLADPDAAARFTAGRLESALTPPSEFPTAAGAVATAKKARPPASPAPPTRARAENDLARRQREHQQRLEQAREAAAEAQQQLRTRRAAHDTAQAALEQARERHRQAQNTVTTAERRLGQARENLQQADRERRQAEEAHRASEEALVLTEREVRKASEEADRLTRPVP